MGTASTWTWNGGSGAADSPSNWTLVGGPGNVPGTPQAGDTAIVTTGTAVMPFDGTLSGETVLIGGTTGAEIDFSGDTARTAGAPSMDGSTVMSSAVPGAASPLSTVLNAAGTFFNDGAILANGPAGSTFTVNVVQGATGAPGYFFNYGSMVADAGNTLAINVGATSELFNVGQIVADAGTVTVNGATAAIAGGYAPVLGLGVIEAGGTLDNGYAYPAGIAGSVPGFLFEDNASGNTLKLDHIRKFSGRVAGFQQGDTIDLGASITVGTIAYDGTTGLLGIANGAGSVVASLVLSTGSHASGIFLVNSGTADGFVFSTGADGDTILTTTAQNTTWDNTSGDIWQDGSHWSGNTAPGAQNTAVIGQDASSPFVLSTGSVATAANSLSEISPFATLQVTSATTIGTLGVQQFQGTIEVAGTASLTTGLWRQYTPATYLQLDPGALLDVTGVLNAGFVNNGTVTIANTNTVGMQVAGSVLVNGATVDAGPVQPVSGNGGFITVGYNNGGLPSTVTVQNGGSVSDTYLVLASDPTSNGALTLSGASTTWTDAGDPNDTVDPRGYSDIGFNSQVANVPSAVAAPQLGGVAQLTIQSGASMIEQTRAFIADTPDSDGSVLVTTGGLWNVAFATGGFLNVGDAGNGTLAVSNGGTVEVGNTATFVTNGSTVVGGGIAVGISAGATGTISVGSGAAASELTTPAGLGVGLGGVGIVDVISNGTVQIGSGGIALGQTAGAFGTLSVSGTGALVGTSSGGIAVGKSGGGLLDVLNGGTVNVVGGGINVGGSVGASGTVVVSGIGGTPAGIALTSGGMNVGDSGQGLLEVDTAGTVAILANGFAAGVTAGASGTVTISGPGAMLALGTATTGVGIGEAGTGTLVAEGGGTLAISAGPLAIGGFSTGPGGGSGSVIVQGETVVNGTTQFLGGTVSVAGNLFVWAGSTISVDGVSSVGVGTGTTLQAGELSVGVSGATLGDGLINAAVINNGSIISSNNATIASSTGGTLEITGAVTGTGSLRLAPASVLKLDGSLDPAQTLFFSSGGAENLILGQPGAGLANAVTNVRVNDRIEFGNGMTVTSVSMLNSTTAAVNFSAGGTSGVYDLTNIAFAGTANHFQRGHDPATGLDFIQAVACFAIGTHIATECGDVAVEALREGDRVRVLSEDRLSTVIWIGHRTIDCARHPQPRQVWPVQILPGAFGPGRPQRTLCLSPDHAVYINDVLVPIRCLINGNTIVQVPTDCVTYYHVELERHAVLLAEGLPAESYLDTGDRRNFANGGGAVALYPDFATRIWEASACAPLVVTDARLHAIRRQLDRYADSIGPESAAATRLRA